MSELRAPQILEMQIQGKTQQEIADTLGKSRMQIWRDRQSEIYQTLVDRFFSKYCDTIEEMMDSSERYLKSEGLKEYGRMLRAGMTKHTQRTHDVHIEQKITIEERRRKNEELIRKLELTPDQYRVLEQTVKPEA